MYVYMISNSTVRLLSPSPLPPHPSSLYGCTYDLNNQTQPYPMNCPCGTSPSP